MTSSEIFLWAACFVCVCLVCVHAFLTKLLLLHQIYCSHKLYTWGFLSSAVLWATGARLLVCAFVCFISVYSYVCESLCVSPHNFSLPWVSNFKTKVNRGFLCPSLSGYDFCAEGLICGENSECKNRNTKAECECKSGYASIHGDSTYCEGRTVLYPAQPEPGLVSLTHNIYLLAWDVKTSMGGSVSVFNSRICFMTEFMQAVGHRLRFVMSWWVHTECIIWWWLAMRGTRFVLRKRRFAHLPSQTAYC